MTRGRRLSEEELALWRGFAHSITPLRGPAARKKISAAGQNHVSPPAKRADEKPQAQRPAQPLPLAPLDRRLKQRVARGRQPIEARLDLHGMTQVQAHAALLGFLQRAQAGGARIVLVVTGKGDRQGEHPSRSERGILRRQVPHWLALPEFRSLIVGFEDAHVGHGGQGALYVRLRRSR